MNDRHSFIAAWPLTTEEAMKQQAVKTLDDCVRMVTACSSFAELKDTQPTYAPTFYTRGMSQPERQAARRVTDAFNAWAARVGRERRAEIRS